MEPLDMVSRMSDSHVDGYIVKLYKKIVNAPRKATLRETMFMTWMNFDCMDILPIKDFRDFSKSLEADGLKEQEKYDSRQKLFLYPISAEKGLLLPHEHSDLDSFPLISLTVLDLKKPANTVTASYRDTLCRCMENCLSEGEHAKGQLFGCLSIYDYVLVLRGNSYVELGHLLAAYRRNLIEAGIRLLKTYTILGLNLNQLAAWKENSDLPVSIRLSCTSQLTTEHFEKHPKLQAALQDKYQVFSVMGKYDYDIVGKIRDTEKFAELFLDTGALSPTENTGIHKTNTRFLLTEFWQASPLPDSSDGLPETAETELNQYIQQNSELTSLCPSIQESLLRLILRLFQTSATVNDDNMRKDLADNLDCFLRFLKIHQSERDQQDEFAKMINCFNLLLDNRMTASMSDFETPQNVLRYSGANLKVLLAYAAYVKKLFSILQHLKDQKKENLRYVPLVTTDTGAKILATIYLSSCPSYRFININIPVDLLFDVKNVLPWLTHEVGHFIRAGWNREQRNAAYFWSVSRIASQILATYISRDFTPEYNAFSMKAFLSLPISEESAGMKFDQYRKSVCQYYQSIFLRCTYDHNVIIQIPHNHTGMLLNKMEEIALILQKIYEESIADIFMIHILGISNLETYLRIQHAYYEHINVKPQKLPLANISRIAAVSIVIGKVNPEDYDGIAEYFCRAYDVNQNTQIAPMLEQLKEYENLYMIEPLVFFLNQYVKTGLEHLLQDEPHSHICEELRTYYQNLRDGSFQSFLNFIENV